MSKKSGVMLLHLGAGCVNLTPLDWNRNLTVLRACIDQARTAGVQVLCLPELCLTGYGCEDAFHSPSTSHRAWEMLTSLLPDSESMVLSLGLPFWYKGALFNTAALLADGQLRGLSAKQALAGDGLHYEPRWFRPWAAGRAVTVETPLGLVPFGDLLYEVSVPGSSVPVRVGFEICEDAWVADRPGRRFAKSGVDLILNPSASHFAFGKQSLRERFVLEGSRAFHCAYVYTNLVGNEAGRAVYDGGALIAQNGRLLASGPRFFLHRHRLETAWVDLEEHRVSRGRSSGQEAPGTPNPQEAPTAVRFAAPSVFEKPAPRTLSLEPKIEAELDKELEFTRAVTLGLLDYLEKSRSSGFVVSLSGGADSAACAALVALTHRRVWAELPAQERQGRFAYLQGGDLPRELNAVLTTVYQATDNSSETTRRAAQDLAESLGARHSEWQVEDLVATYRGLAETSLGRPLHWERDDVALQNIQARVRAPGPWLLANALGALLLSTSNRSEASVGYATMDGDTAGGLAPLAGIDKTYLRRWLGWLEAVGPPWFGPISTLAAINSAPPTAELRPPSEKQTDEEDLMPYPILNAIERSAVLHRAEPSRALERLEIQFPEESREDLLHWITRFFRLYSRNQWKRERYAPSFHLDEWSLDPKTWNRFPILNGGFRSELDELNSARAESRT